MFGKVQEEPTVFAPGKRARMNVIPICLNIFLPWCVFTFVFALLSSKFHYHQPTICWTLSLAGFLPALICGYCAVAAKARDRDPMWYQFLTLAFFIAAGIGCIFGDLNYMMNMGPYFDVDNLNVYPSVNPAHEKGQQMMDAGRVYFADGTFLDGAKGMAFKNLDLYCVAPIVNGKAPMVSYDFWAVGMNCCSGVSSDFRCGEFNNPHARAGLRLMHPEQRPFYRLAVQQAEAAYNIKATHPIFFTWMQDPIGDVNKYAADGMKYGLLGASSYFGFNLLCVVGAVVGFSKIGRY